MVDGHPGLVVFTTHREDVTTICIVHKLLYSCLFKNRKNRLSHARDMDVTMRKSAYKCDWNSCWLPMVSLFEFQTYLGVHSEAQ